MHTLNTILTYIHMIPMIPMNRNPSDDAGRSREEHPLVPFLPHSIPRESFAFLSHWFRKGNMKVTPIPKTLFLWPTTCSIHGVDTSGVGFHAARGIPTTWWHPESLRLSFWLIAGIAHLSWKYGMLKRRVPQRFSLQMILVFMPWLGECLRGGGQRGNLLRRTDHRLWRIWCRHQYSQLFAIWARWGSCEAYFEER